MAERGSEGLDPQAGMRLTLLTLLILALIGVMIVYTGLQAVSTERRFFRDLTFDANHAVAKMLAREFTQVFSNATGLVDDLAQFPAVRDLDKDSTDALFVLLQKRHAILRTLYRKGPDGKVLITRHGTQARNEREWRDLTDAEFGRLAGGSNYLLSREPYFVRPNEKASSPLALTYAVSVEDRKTKKFNGVIGAELNLEFIPDIVAAVQVGRTGQIIVVARGDDSKPRIIFTSRNMQEPDARDFMANFPVERAFEEERTGFEYAATYPKMASYARIHSVAVRPGNALFGQSPFSVPIQPGRIPDWLIVVQQHAQEGYMVADRMKYNVAVLMVVGLVGLLIIGKLWFDSLSD
jgi:hypothetical protein